MSNYYLLKKGEFAYNKSTSNDSPWGAIKRLIKYKKGCVSTLYICFDLFEGDPNFLTTYYETNRWHKAVQMIAAEGARNHGLLNIAPDDFFNTALKIPVNIKEQKCIGEYFDSLDSLITLHQRERFKIHTSNLNLNRARQRSHNQVNVLVFQLLNNMQICLLRCIHTCMP